MKWRLYRLVSRLLHRFDLHYAPIHGPIYPDGDYQRWCQWCGFRQSFRDDKPGKDRGASS